MKNNEGEKPNLREQSRERLKDKAFAIARWLSNQPATRNLGLRMLANLTASGDIKFTEPEEKKINR